MAKHCTVCNRDYADDLAACPHCAAATQTQPTGRGQERTTQIVGRGDERGTRLAADGPSDSTVDLGAIPEEVVGSDSKVIMSEEVASNENPVELVSDSAVDLGAELVQIDEGLAAEDAAEAAELVDGSGIDVGEGVGSPSDSALHPSSAEVDLTEGGASNSGSGIDVGEAIPSTLPPSDSDLGSLRSEMSSGEPAVSEEEVNNLLAGLEETPTAGGARGVSSEEAAEIAEGEEAVAAAEAEEAAEAAEVEEEKPAKAAKPRSPILALAGSGVLGILIGAGGLMGIQALTGSGDKGKQPALAIAPQPRTETPAPAAPTANFETQLARVANGDWDEAKTVGIEMVQASDAKQLLALGEYHLGRYLKETGAKINLEDEKLKPAIQNLQKAADQKDPNALYFLAFIKELAGKLPEARAEYERGAKEFANLPSQKQRFEAAVSRVDWKISLKKVDAAMIPLPQSGEDRAFVLAVLSVAFQQPVPIGQPPAAPPDKPEAGFEFWQAAKLAHEGQYTVAVATLDKARKQHQERRFGRLRKAQNPLSDPAEDIFLRCCDELKAYWQLENSLLEGGYLTGKNTPVEALQALVQKAKGGGASVKDLNDKLAAAQKSQKDSDAQLAQLKPQLQKAANDLKTLANELKSEKEKVSKSVAEIKSAQDQNARLKSDYDQHSATLTKIRTALAEAKLLDPNSKADVSAAVKNAIEVAKSKDSQGMLRRQNDEIAKLSASLKQSRTAEELLPLWMLLLDGNRSQLELADKATMDAKRVLTDPRATAAQKGEAQIVLGLALRNAGQFSEAKKVLEDKRGAGAKGQWQGRANAALREVSHPAAYFASRARDLYDSGRMETALTVLDQAMKVIPANEQGKLLAQRSLIELDAARSKVTGTLSLTAPLLVAANKHADAAIKAGAAEGHYAAGRIAEELGRVDAAIESYRAALAAHGTQLDAEGGRYRMALARVLLLPREARPNRSVGWVKRSETHYVLGGSRSARPTLQKALVLMTLFGLQAPLLSGDEPGLEEAEKLADEVLKAPPGTVPFSVLAQALAVKGRWNQALHVYVEGIRPMLPREYANGLVYLLNNDPRLKRPDSLRTANPLAAEKHFAAGLNFYFEKEYANAEKEFLLTVENDSQDARFFYFLGLSRLSQNRLRDAYADFNQGVVLERLNRPSPAAVSEALERIQGPMRFLVNVYRENPQP